MLAKGKITEDLSYTPRDRVCSMSLTINCLLKQEKKNWNFLEEQNTTQSLYNMVIAAVTKM